MSEDFEGTSSANREGRQGALAARDAWGTNFSGGGFGSAEDGGIGSLTAGFQRGMEYESATITRAAWRCVALRGAARRCVALHGVAWRCCALLQHHQHQHLHQHQHQQQTAAERRWSAVCPSLSFAR